MESVLARYRNLIILVGVLFLQVLGLAVQVKREDNGTESTRLIRIWAISVVTPFERGLVWMENGAGNLWHNYVYLRGVRSENRDLKQQIERMRLEQVRLSEDAAQAHRLQALLAFKEQYVAKTVAAQVIGASGSDLSRIVYIDKGESDGVKRDMAVITANGIVGKVLLTYPSVAQVLLINDQSSGVGVILEKSRLQGVLRGTADGAVTLEKVMSDEQVAAGETVLTSGGDRIFPKGLPVGTVTKVGSGKEGFLNIRVKPDADLSKVEEVLVLVEKQQQEPAEETEHTRAADILAARLPSVPDKPAQPADATAGAEGGAANPAAGANIGIKAPTGAGAPAAKNLPAAAGDRVSGAVAEGAAPTAAVHKTSVTPKTVPASDTGTPGTKPPTPPSRPKTTKPAQPTPSNQPSATPGQPQTPADQDSPN
ncbi:MAG TPA: rod shape-determining protein MreC [Candidatus Acidoferrales bacterium]|nr:rod shape-determining protein MreC [Candidatus Acidoferrales bacterium]